ncbi:MAG: 4Fe-4S dicluster domain-containing protein [Ignavibacteria bacterium]|nr:4Fe-4S dicluster domain-containing protein [Ignavibacteria bacterium]
MNSQINESRIIFTNKARCTDCYRCVRSCPIKAIGIKDGQAYIAQNRCVLCGNCIKECPQNARSYRKDIDLVKSFLNKGEMVAISIAPSFAAIFTSWEIERLPSALRKLGFGYVSETAIGAYYSAQKTMALAARAGDSPKLCSACPAFVNLIERYYPALTEYLIHAVSPMIVHSKMIREKFGADAKIVFAGPCIAKKGEAERPEFAGLIDAVITFDELKELLSDSDIDLGKLEASDFNDKPAGYSALYPLSGGLLKTGGKPDANLDPQYLSVTGYEQIAEIIKDIQENRSNLFVEPLYCTMGCINGAGISSEKNLFERRNSLLSYIQSRPADTIPEETTLSLSTGFTNQAITPVNSITEEQIKQILRKTNKFTPEDELNCGTCGYSTCRDKAIAVLNGMAESEMCLPYMRRAAEQRMDKVIQTSPNGIVILDEHLQILHMNLSFKRMFRCSESIYGKPISYLIDPDDFEQLAAGNADLIESDINFAKYDITCHQKLYVIKEEKQYIGIYVDITTSLADKKQLTSLRSETLRKAEELLEHQLTMAQQLAKFLGDSTARGEELVENLMKLTEDTEKKRNQDKNQWLKNIYTSK